MKRLVFLAPNLEHVEKAVESLHELTVDAAMYLPDRDHNALPQAHLHEAAGIETSSLISTGVWWPGVFWG